ncbi:cytochrome b5 domain-containing protein, putative, partial [Bodo saltans]
IAGMSNDAVTTVLDPAPPVGGSPSAQVYHFDGWRPQITREQMTKRGKVPRYDGCSMKDWQKRHDAKPFDLHTVMQRRITKEEVAQHCDMDDMWMVVQSVVFDVTNFQMYHPGGEQILRACAGKDATCLYETYHRWISCENMIGHCAIGILADDGASTSDAVAVVPSDQGQ